MRILHLLATLSLSSAAYSQASSYTDLVVFGDSLSDNGNFFAATSNPPPPYWSGRFSDGPVWVEQMANHLGMTAASISDHAVGFAKTIDVLNLQLLPYLTAAGSADPQALYVYWAGANDLFELIETPGGDALAVITAAMDNTVQSLGALISSGAQNILVANLPDLSATPLVVELDDPQLTAAIRQLTQAYNGALAQAVVAVEGFTGVDIKEFDAYRLTGSLVAEPLRGGFVVVDERALSEQGVVHPLHERFLFWDHVHPTTRGHSFLVGSALAELGILWGDVDGDGHLTEGDRRALRLAFGPSAPGAKADLNGDGIVDVDDLYLIRVLLR